jgi:hypothetical protein
VVAPKRRWFAEAGDLEKSHVEPLVRARADRALQLAPVVVAAAMKRPGESPGLHRF